MSERAPDQDSQAQSIREAMGFIERDQAKMTAQFEAFSVEVYQLTQRMERLEARLLDLSSKIETEDRGLEPPPHSAGPDIPKDPI